MHGDWWSIRHSARQFSIVKWAMALGVCLLGMFKQNKFNECMMNFIIKKNLQPREYCRSTKNCQNKHIEISFSKLKKHLFFHYSLSGFYLLKYFWLAWATEFHSSEDLRYRNLSLIHPTNLLKIRSKDGGFTHTHMIMSFYGSWLHEWRWVTSLCFFLFLFFK